MGAKLALGSKVLQGKLRSRRTACSLTLLCEYIGLPSHPSWPRLPFCEKVLAKCALRASSQKIRATWRPPLFLLPYLRSGLSPLLFPLVLVFSSLQVFSPWHLFHPHPTCTAENSEFLVCLAAEPSQAESTSFLNLTFQPSPSERWQARNMSLIDLENHHV